MSGNTASGGRHALTGVHNRRYFHETLERECARAHRYERGLALLALDVDDFKQANHRLGHLGGDAVLAAVGECLFGATWQTDVACRIGGDQFASSCRRRALATPSSSIGGSSWPWAQTCSAPPSASTSPQGSPSSGPRTTRLPSSSVPTTRSPRRRRPARAGCSGLGACRAAAPTGAPAQACAPKRTVLVSCSRRRTSMRTSSRNRAQSDSSSRERKSPGGAVWAGSAVGRCSGSPGPVTFLPTSLWKLWITLADGLARLVRVPFSPARTAVYAPPRHRRSPFRGMPHEVLAKSAKNG